MNFCIGIKCHLIMAKCKKTAANSLPPPHGDQWSTSSSEHNHYDHWDDPPPLSTSSIPLKCFLFLFLTLREMLFFTTLCFVKLVKKIDICGKNSKISNIGIPIVALHWPSIVAPLCLFLERYDQQLSVSPHHKQH